VHHGGHRQFNRCAAADAHDRQDLREQVEVFFENSGGNTGKDGKQAGAEEKSAADLREADGGVCGRCLQKINPAG